MEGSSDRWVGRSKGGEELWRGSGSWWN